MAPFYEYMCTSMKIPIDQALLDKLKEQNAKRLDEINKQLEDAEKNLGESDIVDKENSVAAFNKTFEKTVGVGYRIDLVFNLIRIGLFFMDHQLITENIEKAKELMEKGGDWDRKNRLRSYQGLYLMAIRDMKGAADLFLEAVPTFGAYELMNYEELIFYAVITSVCALDRPDLKTKVVNCSEIQQQVSLDVMAKSFGVSKEYLDQQLFNFISSGKLSCRIDAREFRIFFKCQLFQLNAEIGRNNANLPIAKELLYTFYNCDYSNFMIALGKLERDFLVKDRYLQLHCRYFTRTLRIKAYQQFLTPYKTVSLDVMAKSFGVSKEYLDQQLFNFISSGKLSCRIDACKGIIETAQTDQKNLFYKKVIHDGDILLNKVQKLSRIIN
uniref:26S proteasome non-ATPase regulatory subunit 6 n=1 Tax=Meloidogyne floridensis TaxID=298350 RepID=A0A915NQJ0_9BILA